MISDGARLFVGYPPPKRPMHLPLPLFGPAHDPP